MSKLQRLITERLDEMAHALMRPRSKVPDDSYLLISELYYMVWDLRRELLLPNLPGFKPHSMRTP